MKTPQRPNLFQITAALAKSGHSEMAKELASRSGLDFETFITARVNNLAKPKYVREKIRSAYLFPRQVGLTEQQQQDLLVRFIADLREDPKFAELAEPSIDAGTLLRVVLPGNQPIWSYKILLDQYKALGLDRVIADSSTLAAYVRKPRADVQSKLLPTDNDTASQAR